MGLIGQVYLRYYGISTISWHNFTMLPAHFRNSGGSNSLRNVTNSARRVDSSPSLNARITT